MGIKIKESLEKLVNDLTTIEVATLHDDGTSQSVVGYSKISIEGDTIGFVDENISQSDTKAHIASIDQAVKNRDIMIKFIITTLKSL